MLSTVPKILVVGSLNMDFVVRVEHLAMPGETVLSPMDYTMVPGGKGANQACTVGRLGIPVSMLGRVGNDFLGQLLKDNLHQANVQVDMISEDPGHTTGVAFITVDSVGQNSIVVTSGANGLLRPDDIERASPLFAQADYLLTQLEIPLDTVARALNTAKAGGMTTILDPAPAVLLAASLADSILSQVDILTPNENEAFSLLGEAPGHLPPEDAPVLARRLQHLGPRRVIITLGASGACVLEADGQVEMIPAVSVTPIDTTAAGDIFNGALAVALSRGQTLVQAATFANQAAALSVTKPGAQSSIPSSIELDQFIAARQDTF